MVLDHEELRIRDHLERIVGMNSKHKHLPDGESTALWAIRTPGFLGSIKQLICCARCGNYSQKGRNEPMHITDMLRPTCHILCDDCYEALPD